VEGPINTKSNLTKASLWGIEIAAGNLICRLDSKIVDGKVLRKQEEISFVD
jgi:hypothetical protein